MSVGLSRILLIGYTVLALAATGRSVYEILTKFNHAPFAYTFSAVAAAHYFLAILAIARNWRGFATFIMVVELIGVLSVGMLTIFIPDLFKENTVWSYFGVGYGYTPLLLPIIGLWWVWESK